MLYTIFIFVLFFSHMNFVYLFKHSLLVVKNILVKTTHSNNKTVKHFIMLQVPVYAVAQLTGAISASFTLTILLHPIKNVGTTLPSGTDNQALIMEIVVTFSMMFITSAVATDTKAVYITHPPLLNSKSS